MIESVPRMRMFAGPNGSGKSTLRFLLRPELTGVYINPDEIQNELQQSGRLSLSAFGIESTQDEIRSFLSDSSLMQQARLTHLVSRIEFTANAIVIHEAEVNAYLASVAADFIRRKLIAIRTSFTFETVMSAKDKIELLRIARTTP